MTLPISVFIITRNEARRIEATIKAANSFSAEVVVVDSGSTDDTVDLAKRLGAKVYSNEWKGYGPQKRFAEDRCTSDWFFNLDADEIVTDRLREELERTFAAPPEKPTAFRVRIHNVYPGDKKPRWRANDYNVVRLYHRDAGRYRDHTTYDRVVLKEGIEVRQLENPVYHFSIVDWHQMVDKGNRFSSHHLEKSETRNAMVLKVRLFTEFPWYFIKDYIFRGHIWGGSKGFVFALNTAFMRTMRVAKMLEVIERKSSRE